MPRSIWKGAISFGLVYIPVNLYPGTSDTGVSFDWLDKRSMDPVGYKRINKRTGTEIGREDIVKGVKADNGEYVILTEDEIKAAYPKTTQTIEIESFVEKNAIPFVYLEKPYYLEPQKKGEKVYALLREAMLAADVVGIARVVMHTKEHLAALIPDGAGLVLNTLRWSEQVRDVGALELPAAGVKAANLKEAELKMAQQLIGELTVDWDPAKYTDHFADAVHALVQQRAAAGDTEKVEPLEEGGTVPTSNVVDLTELLKRSLGGGKRAAPAGRTQVAANEEEAEVVDQAPARKTPAKAAKKAKTAEEPATKAASKVAEKKPASTPARRKAA